MSLRESVITGHLQRAGVPQKYRHTTLAEFTPRPHQREAYQEVVRFVEFESLHDRHVSNARPVDEYPEDKGLIGRGLLLAGDTGTGKTALATAAVVTIFRNYLLPIRFIAAADYVAETIEQMHLDDKQDPDSQERWMEIQDRLRDVREVPILLLDDLGHEHRSRGSEYSQNTIEQLIRTRSDNGRPTIVTTSHTPRGLEEIYGSSFTSVAKDVFDTIFMVNS